jgi:hypothetical protein
MSLTPTPVVVTLPMTLKCACSTRPREQAWGAGSLGLRQPSWKGLVMASATIKLYLPHGDGTRLRTAEISNWSGKALAAPRIDLDDLLAREELEGSGVYILAGVEPATSKPMAYIGEAEILSDRLKTHKNLDFWITVVAFLSKDENLTKSHIRYLEGRLIDGAKAANRFKLQNAQSSGAKLPEADRADMEELLVKIHQLLPVLGSELLTPIGGTQSSDESTPFVQTEIKGLVARGKRTPAGFVVLANSQAVIDPRPSAEQYWPTLLALRQQLLADGSLVQKDGHLSFTKDVEFSSPSQAASIVHGGNMNGLTAWKDARGVTLSDLDKG